MQSHIPKSNISPPLGILLAIVSGLLLFSSFVYLPYLSFISFIPLLFLIERSSPKRLFFYGLLAGFTLYIPLLSFILVMEVPIRFYLYFGVFLLWLCLSFYYGLWCSITKIMLQKIGGAGWIFSIALFVSFEFLRSLTKEIGFPWATIGYTLVPQKYLIQIADITSIAGLSFLIILTNILLYNSFKRPILVIPLILTFSGVVGYGRWRIESFHKLPLATRNPESRITVLVVQPNILPDVKRKGEIYTRAEVLKRASQTDLQPHLIIWPESALPGYMIEGSEPERIARQIVDSVGAPILMGGLRISFKDRRVKAYNSAFFVEPHKDITEFYDKIYLVPFGERLPFDEFFLALKKLEFGQGRFSPGEERTLFTVNGMRFGVLICFESIFPRYVRKFVKEGADFMVNITDDSWFGRTVGPYEHARMAILRAVETRRTLVRCGNTGISYIATPDGNVKHKTGLFEEAVISGDIYPIPVETFYTKYGDVFSYVMILIAVMGIVGTWFSRRSIIEVRRPLPQL
ncbi:MAG: apolipoprotein N-acyltransferase [bacterium (Candidatus Stahlbacteria) CG08_land_8_20_14_0_20_40_26]|nr:MAG: apolipoprotein N-acyltransferase [bacterium (Candidatus Stahlbacteria) CG23_combo_of_CG06-09_8_20_14_all_40_9]PIS23571.1 MAG: apolipoprotein N-acyltransferase [bacterium (Candidatus Stahlbacteria) CG08_land_8_20_14_0_20_40_26]